MLLQYATFALLQHWMYCSTFFYCHNFTVFILFLILNTTTELLMCGKALPRINMITFIPSPTVFLSALINLAYTYFGLTFTLIGQESTEECPGTKIIPYYSKTKKGQFSIRNVISQRRHIIKTLAPSLVGTVFCFMFILNSFSKFMYFSVKTLLLRGYFLSFCPEILPTVILS